MRSREAVLGRTEPRVFTPPLRELTPETTLGFEAIDFIEGDLGMELVPWQRWVLVHGLEIEGDLGGEWVLRYRNVVVEVGRQQGKTTVGAGLALFFMYVLGARLVIGTAQDLEQAEDAWAETVEIATENEALAEEIEHVWRTNGGKRMQLTGNRNYRVKASNRRAGRGKSGDLLLLDELREHQNWEAWGALTKTTIAKPNGLVWCMSNAGDASSAVLRHLRVQAHRALGDPDGWVDDMGDAGDAPEDTTLGWFEWSCPPDCEPTIENLAYANPSLGYGFVTARALLSARATDPRDVFTMECMCQWVHTSIRSPFPEGAWEAGIDDESRAAPDSPLFYGIDVAEDRAHSAIAVCGLRADGRHHVELIAYRAGTQWLLEAVRRLTHGSRRHVNVALTDRGAPVSGYADLLGAIDGVTVHGCHGANVAAWAGRLWDAVSAALPDSESDAEPLAHIPQPRLDVAAAVAVTRPMGDGAWGWDRVRSTEDISPLIAVTMAYGLATNAPEKPKEKPSAYAEGAELMFV
ncbi:terminase [Eggerthellaceae bacterium zg-997]|nr:terminase [Eggerthellaceae bacterium zg-997]